MKKEFSIVYKQFSHWTELDKNDQSLVESANDAMSKAYAPYSNFNVGAVALLSNGELVKGNNQENIAYSAESSTFKTQADIVMEATPSKHKPLVIIDVTLND